MQERQVLRDECHAETLELSQSMIRVGILLMMTVRFGEEVSRFFRCAAVRKDQRNVLTVEVEACNRIVEA